MGDLDQQRVSTKQQGDAAEAGALAHLQAQGLRLLARNYRTPGRGGGEIDLIMRDRDGTLVFVEVRQRSRSDHGCGCQHRFCQAAAHCVGRAALLVAFGRRAAVPL